MGAASRSSARSTLESARPVDWHNEPNHSGDFKLALPDQEQSNRDVSFQAFDPRIGGDMPRVVLAGDGVFFQGGRSGPS